MGNTRIIAHIDMDAFFAAVEERDNPQWKGMPIVVGADPMGGKGRGVVSTANYAARAYGIHSALPISTAWQLAEAARTAGKPAVIFAGSGFERYAEVSGHIMDIIRSHVPLTEQASIDEAYMDVSFCGSYKKAEALCEKIKKEIKDKKGLTCSVGIGPNKLVAKIASGFKKPDGMTVLELQDVEAFFEKLPVRSIPGIGPKTESALAQEGIRKVSDLKRHSRVQLQERFGKWGSDLYDRARGLDDAPVTEEYDIKSIGEQETFAHDTRDAQFIFERVGVMCGNIMRRLQESSFRTFRTVVVTVRFTGFETKTRSHTLAKEQSGSMALNLEATRMLLPFLDARENPGRKLIRLVGVRVEKLK